LKRDLDLIRKIVLAVEASPTGFAQGAPNVEGYSDDQIGYHSYLLIDGGFAKGPETTTLSSTGPSARIMHLTSKGHDFAESARDEARWKKATGIVKEKVGDATIDIIKDVLTGLLRDGLGI
jgi:hypothetical protein